MVENTDFNDIKLKEIMNQLDKDHLSKLKYIYTRVNFLKESGEILNKHEKESFLQDHKNLGMGENTPQVGSALWDYIMLEIDSFYSIIHSLMWKGQEFPKLPTYLKELRKFRNKMPGHRDDRNEFVTWTEWYEFHKTFEKFPSSNKVVNDFLDYCKTIFINNNKIT